MSSSEWEFWIDVGGTFSDCLGRSPDDRLHRVKVLSSGTVKGAFDSSSRERTIIDPARREGPPNFWKDYLLRWISPIGQVLGESLIIASDPERGLLVTRDPPPDSVTGQGGLYEIVSDEGAPALAIRMLLGLERARPIPKSSIRLGTTRGTNALLTRTGAKVAFITTRGFADVLEVGYQNRAKLFELAIQKKPLLFSTVLEIDERISATGTVLKTPDRDAVLRDLRALKERKIDSLAICLLHAYRYPEHERIVRELARQAGFEEISLSSEVAPLVKIVSRGDTTSVDAYLNPVLRSYVERLRQSFSNCDLRVMTSSGGLVSADRFVGKDSILSGPAGGVVGFAQVAKMAGFERAIGFDMGGTSTDVSRFDGSFELQTETEKDGIRVVTPMLAIETIAAGGGSICDFDGVKLVVGPKSSGAEPGPACYGRGGPLSVTDLNFRLGKILPAHFPFPLQADAVEQRLQEIAMRVEQSSGVKMSALEICEGFLRIANSKMARAIRSISVGKGYDPREYVLVAFGGAAGQHACGVAKELGMTKVLCPRDASVLSAYGIGQANISRHRAEGVYCPLDEAGQIAVTTVLDRLAEQAIGEVMLEGARRDQVTLLRSLDLRYRGVDACLTIPLSDWEGLAEGYAQAHERTYGYHSPGRAIEIAAARVEAIGKTAKVTQPSTRAPGRFPDSDEQAAVYCNGVRHAAGVYLRANLRPGDQVKGPAMIVDDLSVVVVEPEWQAETLTGGEIVLEDLGTQKRETISTQFDPVQVEIFNQRFAGIAEQMGITLRNTSCSVNVKERLDFSCAIFTRCGDLVVNAPHIPVHLGAMAETIRHVLIDNPVMQPGDVFVTNDPFRGGSHIPDVTVVTPVHHASGELMFFTASRAHHAEIGGIAPGSMPPFSKNLGEEGVLIRNFKLIDGKQERWDELRSLLMSGPFPSRSPADNLADIAAQLAANRQGVRELLALVDRYGWPVVSAYMEHIQSAAERKLRQALSRLTPGKHSFEDHLDDGSPIRVTIEISDSSATIDFSGTGGVLPGNLNANRAIVTAAIVYVLRCLIDEDIPLNQGVLTPVRIILPVCLLNPQAADTPEKTPAVVGGNVETSQRVVDVLLGALQLAAASQGTMNNLLFGNDSFGYYETICGGSGATADSEGASAVHTHMTNTRLTDPEVLELRYPVRLEEFSIRRGSGGMGRHRGGDGVVRRIRFLQPLCVSILSQRRGKYCPYGMAGGGAASAGENILKRASGEILELPGLAQFDVSPGDELTLRTPGGGGYGAENT